MSRPSSIFERRAAITWLLAIVCAPAWPQAGPPLAEYQVKAAFLYKFSTYVEWPAQAFERPDSPFVIGVAGGNDTFIDTLARTASGRQIGGRPIDVRKLRRGASLEGLQVLFIARSGDTAALADMVASAKGQAVLTVTEAEPDPHPAGSMINFVVEGNKVRFDIAPAAADQRNLKISARLLSVARRVIGRPAS